MTGREVRIEEVVELNVEKKKTILVRIQNWQENREVMKKNALKARDIHVDWKKGERKFDEDEKNGQGQEEKREVNERRLHEVANGWKMEGVGWVEREREEMVKM